jgi:Phosphotransferase enzyme family
MISTKTVKNDARLPTLATLLAAHSNHEIVKYSPEKRCTIRVIRNDKNYYAKVYPTKFSKRSRGEKIHRIGTEFWNLAEAGKLNFRVAKPIEWNAETQTLWHENLKGLAAIESLKSIGGRKIVHRIGQAVALIARCQIAPPRCFDYAEQLKDSTEFAEQIVARFPRLASATTNLLNSFAAVDLPERELAPVHGDMHIDQWLTDNGALGLLDFEDFSLGHPERDLAFFMVQLETEHGKKVDFGKLNDELINGYESIGGKPDARLLKIYAAHKWFSKAAKAVNSAQAEICLRRAVDCLKNVEEKKFYPQMNTDKHRF